MRAIKINEIKRNQEASGLSAIGVGRAYMRSTYETIKKNWPDYLGRTVEKMFEHAISVNKPTGIKEYIDEIANELDCPLDKMFWIKINYDNHSDSNYAFIDFINNEYGEDGIPIRLRNEKLPKTSTYEYANIRTEVNYKKSFGSIFYDETVGEGMNQYEQNEISGVLIPS